MIPSQNTYALSDFQRRPASHVRRLRKSGLPEVLTVKGRAELIVQTAAAYQALLNRLEMYESAIATARGLKNIAQSRSATLDDFHRRMKSRFPSLKKKRSERSAVRSSFPADRC